MKRPTPDPTPHFETTSSMKRMRTPPIAISTKSIDFTPTRPIPSDCANCGSAGRKFPTNTIGKPVRQIITSTRNFCSP
jgi:hypothetical protein